MPSIEALATVLLVSSLGGSVQDAQAEDARANRKMATEKRTAMRAKLTADHRFGDLLDHPAFGGFSGLLLPSTEGKIDRSARLGTIASLLPYHQNVDLEVVLQGLNRLIDDVDRGQQVLYDIYTQAEKQRDRSKVDTGLFFVRGRPGAPFAVIAPGGGFAYVGSVHEGFPYALEINQRGYNAFVLRYRAGLGQAAATQDLAAALAFVVRNAEDLNVSTDRYSLWGSSAGARMVASIGTHGTAKFGQTSCLGRPPSSWLTQVTPSTRRTTHPLSRWLVSATALHRHPRWSDVSIRCGRAGSMSSFESTRPSGTASEQG